MPDDHPPVYAKVFISYSRKDAAFAERLAARLAQAHFVPLIDREAILPGEEWKERLSRLVLESDTVVFIISPDSAVSAVCRWELSEAQRHSKRLLPLIYRAAPTTDIPETVQAINWIDFCDDAGFSAASETLESALLTDIAWLREHTRVQELANHWLTRGKPSDALLRGDSLTRAEAWKQLYSPATRQAVTPLQEEFLTESRIVFDREERERIAQINEAFIAQSRFLNEHAHEYWRDKNDYVTAALILLEALPSDEDAVVRPLFAEAERILNVLTLHFPEEAVATICERGVLHGKLSPDAKLIATSCVDGTVRVSNLEEVGARERLVIEHGHVGDMDLQPERHGSGGRMTANPFGPPQQNYDFSAASGLFAVSHSKEIAVWDLTTKTKILDAKVSRNVVCFHPRHEELFFVDSRDCPVIWDATTKAVHREFMHAKGTITHAQFSENGDQIFLRYSDGNCSIFNITTKQRIGKFRNLSGAILDWDSGGMRLIAADPGGHACVWTPGRFTASWRVSTELPKLREDVILAKFIKGAAHVVLVVKSGAVYAYDTGANKLINLHGALPSEVLHCAFSEDCATLLFACRNATVELRSVLVRDPASAREMTIGGHTAPVTFVAFGSRANNTIISTSLDGTCRRWTTEGPRRAKELAVPGAFVASSCYSNDGSVVLTVWSDGMARIIDASSGAFLDEIPLGEGAGQRIPLDEFDAAMKAISKLGDMMPAKLFDRTVSLQEASVFLFMSAQGVIRYNYRELRIEKTYAGESTIGFSAAEAANMLLTLSSDGTVSMYDLEDGHRIHEHRDADDPIVFGKLYPDGRRIFTISKSGAAIIRDGDTLQPHAKLDISDPTRYAWVSADGKRLVTLAPSTEDLTLWDADSGAKIRTMTMKWLARGAAISPDATKIVTYAKDPVAVLWSATDGETIHALSGPEAHSDDVVAAEFSSDGSRILTAARDGSIRLWSVATGEQINTLLGLGSPILDAKLSPLGNSVFAAWQDGRARLWAVSDSVEDLVGYVRRSVPRALTPDERRKLFLRKEPPKWVIAQKKWPYDNAEITKVTATLYRIGGTTMPIMIAGADANTVRVDEFALHYIQRLATTQEREHQE